MLIWTEAFASIATVNPRGIDADPNGVAEIDAFADSPIKLASETFKYYNVLFNKPVIL